MKQSCFTADSIRLMAEAASIPEPSHEVADTISVDATFRLKQIITRAIKFMQHSNRTKLTCSDVNKALKWSDCQPVFGHECNPNEKLRYSYSTEAHVFRYENNKVDLVQRYKDEPKIKVTEAMMHEAAPKLRINDIY